MLPLRKLIGKKYLLLAALVLILLLKFCGRKKYSEFPELKIGRYQGQITIKKNNYDLLMQKDKLGATIAIIAPGSTAKRIELSSNLKIEVPNINQPVNMLGEKLEDHSYKGNLFLKNKILGRWNLKKISSKDAENLEVEGFNEEIKKYFLLKQETKRAKEEVQELNSRISTYQEAIQKEEKLRAIAVSETDDLNYSIEEKHKTRKKVLLEIKNKVTELEQLQRISALGRAIDLARRTTKREDRWYLANWGEEGIDESQQQIADSLGVDLAKLKEKLDLAQEYIKLKDSINFEARRIEELRNTKLQITQPDLPNQEQEKPKKKNGSFWNKVGDLFNL